MNRISESDRAELLIFLNEFNKKKSDISKRKFIIDNLLTTKHLNDSEKNDYSIQIEKILNDHLFSNRLNEIKLADLPFFVLIYYKSLEKKEKNSPTKTEANNWYKRVKSLKKNLIEVLKESPNKYRTEQISSYIRKENIINIINTLRERKIIAHTDKDMIDVRYKDLKNIIKVKYNNNNDLLDFLETLKKDNYISPLSYSEKENNNECNELIYRQLIYKNFGSIDYTYFDFIDRFLFEVSNKVKTVRNDENTHRTCFIKDLYNVKSNNERPYSIELIATLILILYEESKDLDHNSAIRKVKKIIEDM